MARPRKKATDEPAPDGAVVDHEGAKEVPPPSLLPETVDGLLDLREHLTRVPSGLLWPLQTLPSMTQHLSDLESAGEAVDRLAVRRAMSSDKMAELRRFLISDAYAMTYLVCRHRDMVPEVHMAMCYASAGQAQRLAWLITQSGFEGYVIDRFRAACASRAIDPRTSDGIVKLDRALDWQNHRWARRWYKSSAITHGGTVVEATVNPNTAILIVCAKEDKAHQLVAQAGETVQSGIYRDIFPDRVPKSSRDVSAAGGIIMAGRNVSAREKTIQGTSYVTREISGHYPTIRTDDIVIRDVRGGIIGGGADGPAIRWLHGMGGMRVTGKRQRRIHVGTINALEDDDHAWLTFKRRNRLVMSFVVPAETYKDGVYPDDVFERGTPTAPTFFNEAAITEALEETVADETEYSGVEAFRSDFWLAPSPASSGRLFTDDAINDPDRTWMGPYAIPDKKLLEREPFRFLLGRIERDADGDPITKNTKKTKLDVAAEDWHTRASIVTFDPWSDMDRIVTLNTTWASGAKNWALTVTAVDPLLTHYQLETRAGESGMDEWATVLRDIDKLYKPRVIGIDRKAFADSIVQNALATDLRLTRLHRKVVAVDQSDASQESRIRAGVSELLKSHRLMLLAPSDDPNDYGAAITRKEMLMFRADSEKTWPILESFAMVCALVRPVLSREQRKALALTQKEAAARYASSIDPRLGVPNAA